MSDSLNAQALPEVSLCRDLTAPKFDLAAIDMQGLALMLDYFEGLSSAAVGFLNQPRFKGPAADWLEDHAVQHVGMWCDRLREELVTRMPANQEDATIRAQALILHMAQCEDWADVAAMAGALVDNGK